MNRHEIRWRVYRATFDTNVLLRTLIQQGNLANRLLSLWREGRFVLNFELKRALFEFGVEVVEPPVFLENIRNAEVVVEVSNKE